MIRSSALSSAAWKTSTFHRATLALAMTASIVPATDHAVGVSAEVGFTSDQADAGKVVYAANCGACHGTELDGLAGPSLRGSRFAFAWLNGQHTAGELLHLIADTMPLTAPHSLSLLIA
jgi:mono/diheme cytochrome c family protein